MTENSPSSSEPSHESDRERAAPIMATPASAEAAPKPARLPLPGWAWALIAVTIIVFLASAATTTIIVASGLASATSYECDEFGELDGCTEGATTKARSESTSSASGSATAGERIPLAGNAVFDGLPVWALTLEPTWQELDLDLVGITVFQDDATGCELIASQSLAAPDTENAGDAVLSPDLLTQEIKALTAGNSEALVLNAGAATDIPIAGAGSGSSIDFASATISQRNADEVAMSTEIVARSMPDSGGALVAMLTCETATIPTFGEKFDFFSTGLAVTVGP